MRPLVILRPEPGAGKTAERAAELGLKARIIPLFVPRAVEWDAPAPDRFDALLLTSANAARLAGERLADYRTLPAYAVGRATANAMQEAGFAQVIAGDGDGTAIARRIAADGHGHVLHLAGRTVAPVDGGALRIDRIVVYEMLRTRDDRLAERLEPDSVLLVHSPRAGEVLAQLVGPRQRASLHLIAISPAALAACGSGWASAQTPDKPDDERMLALALRLCE
ncbi:Uroporphyrinogen III synthase HEM4 [Sphingobium chlorophenolicum L-1]|uniref:Uroporphyrinogen III synthase HEM4 n=1 Tax=Sphingobium chlorophenolicum L-1 TaxID=690566 RepID=F6EXS5_SPHCR|nr:uroporphyrinogen-III synthase [Sphingobium chlorophenolicum]AEG49989.1 Uroporphyrinogen III synthase HEM4 [Sphingobium chlorophenolicum L-1]